MSGFDPSVLERKDRDELSQIAESLGQKPPSRARKADIVDLILKVKAVGYSIEASNPRHDHEWKVWQDVKLPDGKVLIPGVVGHASDFVEHPELVAERLLKYAGIVGRHNVIAGTDCGLGTRVGHPKIAWAKFEALAEGAQIASAQLWG